MDSTTSLGSVELKGTKGRIRGGLLGCLWGCLGRANYGGGAREAALVQECVAITFMNATFYFWCLLSPF